MLCYAMLCDAMLCYTMLYAMLLYAMLLYAMLCYAALCYAMLFSPALSYTMLYMGIGEAATFPAGYGLIFECEQLFVYCACRLLYLHRVHKDC